MTNEQGREYAGTILFKPLPISTPQIILDCSAIYASQTAWIATYAALPTTLNPPPIFYEKPGWKFFLENLQINYYAPSLPTAPAPEIKANSTQNDKLVAVKAISREFKRFEFLLLQRELPASEWHTVGIEIMHNYGNIFNYLSLKNPFLTQGEVDILSSTTQLAIQFKTEDVSRKIALPTASDIFSIRGCWQSTVTL